MTFISMEQAEDCRIGQEIRENQCKHEYFLVDIKKHFYLEGKWQRCKKCGKMLDITNVPEEMLVFK